MNKVALSLTINKFINHFESTPYFLIFDTLENAKTELINILATHQEEFKSSFYLHICNPIFDTPPTP
jgi:hypothetical protein